MFFQLGLCCKKDCLFLNVFSPLKGKAWSFSRDGGMGYFQLFLVWKRMNCHSLSILNITEKSQDQANLSAILKLFIFLQLFFCFLQNIFPLQNAGVNNFP